VSPLLVMSVIWQVARTPTATAIETQAGTRLSYAELFMTAQVAAVQLRACGVSAGVIVGTTIEGVEMLVTHLAVLLAGGAFAPLDASHERAPALLSAVALVVVYRGPQLTSLAVALSQDTAIVEVETLFPTLFPSVLFSTEGCAADRSSLLAAPFGAGAGSAGIESQCGAMPEQDTGKHLDDCASADDLCWVFCTSGSSSDADGLREPAAGLGPRAVLTSHRSAVNYVRHHPLFPPLCDEQQCDKVDAVRVLVWSARTFDPSAADSFGALARGGCVCLWQLPGRRVPMTKDEFHQGAHDTRTELCPGGVRVIGLAKALQESRATHVSTTPSLWQSVQPHDLAVLPSSTPEHLRVVGLGGEVMDAQLARVWAANVDLFNLYGCTECTGSPFFPLFFLLSQTHSHPRALKHTHPYTHTPKHPLAALWLTRTIRVVRRQLPRAHWIGPLTSGY